MGFYSIYKIIKDMVRTLFGKKFLKIFIIIILIFTIFFIYNECFAYGPFVFNGISFNFRDTNWDTAAPEANYLTILRYNSGNNNYLYCACKSSYPIFLTNLKNGSHANYPMVSIYSRNNGKSTTFTHEVSFVSKSTTNVTFNGSSTGTVGSLDSYYISFNIKSLEVIYSDTEVYLGNEQIYNPYKEPSLGNTQNQLENLNFSNFIINANSYTDEIENNDGTLFMLFYNRSLSNSSSTEGLYPIKEKAFTKGSIYTDYESSTSDNMVFSYPIFKTGVFFNIGSTYEIRFAKQVYNSEYNTNVYEYLGEPIQFTISTNVTQDYINQLNQQTATSTDEDKQQEQLDAINNQTNAIENQTQSIDNINNSITDSTVDNSSIDLPTDNTQDITQSGVDNIFQTIYNSFTSGTAQDIIFPIPFTDKSITLQANYIYNMLNNNGASWIINIIQAFYWYFISRFIITDIMRKIRKIKQGNFENLQNSNIKEDML